MPDSALPTSGWGVDRLLAGLIGASVFLIPLSLKLFFGLHLFLMVVFLVGSTGFNRHLLFLASYASVVFVVYNRPGFDVYELSYYVLTMLYLIRYLIPSILSGRVAFDTGLDKLFLAIVLIALFYIFVGILFSGKLVRPFEEFAFYYSPLLFYPYIRDNAHQEGFRKIFIALTYWILYFAIVRTAWDYYNRLMNVVAEWEFNFIRGAGNENVLLFGAFLSFFMIIYSETKKARAFQILTFALCAIGLVLTLTRSVWIGFAFGIGVSLLFGSSYLRTRTIVSLTSVLVSIVLIMVIFFQEYALFAWEILQFRFAFVSSNTIDLSFLERWYETNSVLDAMSKNPILGYGLGAEYMRYDIFRGFTKNPAAFIHNGYLAVYFKFGIVGLITFTSTILLMIYKSIQLYKATNIRWIQGTSMAFITYLSSALLINLVTPVFLFFEGVFLMSVIGGFISMLSIHYLKPTPV